MFLVEMSNVLLVKFMSDIEIWHWSNSKLTGSSQVKKLKISNNFGKRTLNDCAHFEYHQNDWTVEGYFANHNSKKMKTFHLHKFYPWNYAK